MFLEISQNPQENTWGLQLNQKRDSDTGVFLWILRHFSERLFYRTPLDGCSSNYHLGNIYIKILCIDSSSITDVRIEFSTCLIFCKKKEKYSHLPKHCFMICFNDSPSKMMKKDFYFILKTLFVLKIFTFFVLTF